MKKILFTALLASLLSTAAAQVKLDSARFHSIDRQLRLYRKITNLIYIDSNAFDYPQLVSRFTFRALAQKDYTKITIGENSFSKVGRFATVNINSDESKFYFTPVTFVKTKDPTKGPFTWIHSIDFSGEVNDQNIFDFKNKKSIRGSYGLTYVINSYKFDPPKRNIKRHEEIVEAAYQLTLSRYQKALTTFSGFLDISDEIEESDSAKRRESVKQAFFKALDEYEEKYYDDKWNTKKISWFKLNASALGWDNFSYIDPDQLGTLSKPGSKSVYSGNLKLSFNQLYTYKSTKNQFYWAIYAAIGRKNTLSEISKPAQWYNMKQLTDSTVTVADDKKVFVLKDADFRTMFRPDAGVQAIYLFNPYKDMSIGFDFASSMNGLVTEKGDAYVNRTSLGILFPFLDKNGESTINVELFYQRKSYINIPLSNEGIWGIKFGLPFKSI